MSMIVIVGILVAVCVFFSAFLIVYWQDVKDIIEVRGHHRKNEVLLVDLYREKDYIGTHWRMRERRTFSTLSEAQIRSMGYMDADKWEDRLRYLGFTVYVRLHGFTKPPEPNKITSSTLWNVYNSRTVNRFIAGIMTKVGFAPMDIKTLAILIPVAIGIVIGMWYFMSGGLK